MGISNKGAINIKPGAPFTENYVSASSGIQSRYQALQVQIKSVVCIQQNFHRAPLLDNGSDCVKLLPKANQASVVQPNLSIGCREPPVIYRVMRSGVSL